MRIDSETDTLVGTLLRTFATDASQKKLQYLKKVNVGNKGVRYKLAKDLLPATWRFFWDFGEISRPFSGTGDCGVFAASFAAPFAQTPQHLYEEPEKKQLLRRLQVTKQVRKFYVWLGSHKQLFICDKA